MILANKITVGASESMSKSKKNTIDPEIIIKKLWCRCCKNYLFYLIVHQKKTCNGLIEEWSLLINFLQKFWLLHTRDFKKK